MSNGGERHLLLSHSIKPRVLHSVIARHSGMLAIIEPYRDLAQATAMLSTTQRSDLSCEVCDNV
jgi:hypothetical protein